MRNAINVLNQHLACQNIMSPMDVPGVSALADRMCASKAILAGAASKPMIHAVLALNIKISNTFHFNPLTIATPLTMKRIYR